MKLWSKIGIALAAVGMLCAAAPAAAQERVVVWWVKGFYPSEDAALFDAVKKFEAKTGVKVELSQYAVQDGIPKTVAALDSGTPPDVVKKLSDALAKVYESPEYKKFLEEQFADPNSFEDASKAPAFVNEQLNDMKKTIATN